MATDKKMLNNAALIAAGDRDRRVDQRTFLLGAIGLRNDDVLVSSRNVPGRDVVPDHHAEARLSRKLTPGSTVWVARVARRDGSWAMARPCPGCEIRLRSSGVKRVVYTIGPNEWGVMDL
jgi:tRNA(Arg) A34 adenosine deaminase TadA